jgi:hypothetical protein
MRILVAVSVKELTFVGVGFEKTRNLKLVTQNFFVPLHPEIGQDAPTVRFKALRAVQCASRVQSLRLFKWPAAVLSPLRYESGRAERKALRAFKWYKIEIS